MSRTINRTSTKNSTADACIANALRNDERARTAHVAMLAAHRAGDEDKEHAACLEWANAAHFAKRALEKGRKMLAEEGRDPQEILDVVSHARDAASLTEV